MTPQPRHATSRRIGRRGLLIGGLAVVPLAAFGGYQAFSVADGLGDLKRTITLPSGTSSSKSSSDNSTSTADPAEGQAVDVMLLGSDSRDADTGDGRSDTIMLLHLDADRQRAYLISFPRDMWVSVPGHGTTKINAAYSYGGSELTARTLNKLTGVEIDHAAVVDFSGFADLTAAVGGVTVTNTQAFQTHGFNYPKGKIKLSGRKALWFVRDRHDLANGDFDRAANQRKVVKALAAKIASPSTLASPTRLAAVIKTVSKYVTVDSGLSNSTILGLARSMKSAAGSLVTLQAPVSGTAMISGQSVDVVDTQKMRKLAKALQNDTMAGYVSKAKSNSD